MIPTFEGLVLIGALVNLGALLYFCRLLLLRPPVSYDRRFSRDRFGLFVEIPEGDAEKIQDILKSTGPEGNNEW